MPDYNQMRVNPSSKPPKPTRPKDPPARTQKDEFIIEGSGKAGKSGKGLSTQEVMDIADIAVKLFNSKKYPTLYDDATLRERNRTEGAPSLRMSFQPTYDGVELATDIASNPTPVGIGIAVAKQLLKLDIMGEVEAQIANTRQIQLHEEDRHRDIASAEEKKRNIERQRLQSKNKVVFGDLQKRLSFSLSVRTGGNVEVPKVTYDNLKKYIEPPKVFKDADNTKFFVMDKSSARSSEKFMTYEQKLNARLRRDDVKTMITALSTIGNDFFGNKYNPYILLRLTEEEKQHYFKTDAKKTLAILYSEFVEGTGKEVREFSEDMPITEEIKKSYTTELFLDYFIPLWKKGKVKQNVKDKKTIFTSPDNAAKVGQSVKAHGQVLWNFSAFFTGSLDYEYTLKGNILYLRVHNEYSISSGVSRDKSDDLVRQKNKVSPLGNTKQYFNFKIDLSKL